MSGITKGKYAFYGHNAKYWEYPGNVEREVFANLYAMEALKSKDKECEAALKILQDNLPEIGNTYHDLLRRAGL